MNNELYQWQLKNGNGTPLDFTSFPLAFRAMFNQVRKSIEDKTIVDTSKFLILGPKDPRGERRKYNYNQAMEFARSFGLVNAEGYLNGKEFKRKSI